LSIRSCAPPIGTSRSSADTASPVAFGGDDARWEAEHAEDAGSNHERLAGAGEGVAERLDRRAVGAGGAGEVAGEAMSCLNARWITPSTAAASSRRTSGTSSDPARTSTPADRRAAAAASERCRYL
jgi:hypothetical protein